MALGARVGNKANTEKWQQREHGERESDAGAELTAPASAEPCVNCFRYAGCRERGWVVGLLDSDTQTRVQFVLAVPAIEPAGMGWHEEESQVTFQRAHGAKLYEFHWP